MTLLFKLATTPEFWVDKCDSTFTTRKWLPKVYIERYVAQSEECILIESTSSKTSSPFSMAYETTIGNQISNGGNFIRASR